MAEQARYGVDAPGAIWKLYGAGILGLLVGLFAPPVLQLGNAKILLGTMGWSIAIFCPLGATLMLLYSLRGKLLHRDQMLAMHTWRGCEQVLDVGTGRGLLLAGAAKRLTTGVATGLDIWQAKDLSGNGPEATQRNLEIEGVATHCRLVNGSADAMPFPDASFDVVVSNLCLHNISDRAARARACREIARVLRPGGIALLSDMMHTRQYRKVLAAEGLTTRTRGPYLLMRYPPLWVVAARKAQAGVATATRS